MADSNSISPQGTVTGSIELREGAHISIPSHETLSTRELVELALNGSMAMRGKPVRCVAVVPGVSMSVSTGRLYPCDGDEAQTFAADIWIKIESKLAAWLKMRTPPAGMTMEVGDTTFLFGWDGRQSVNPGAMEIEVQHKPGALSRYLKERHRKPLAIAKVSAQPQTPDSTAHVAKLVVDAISRSRQTCDRQLSRLPGSIRYRVTGAMAAWNAVREAVDRLTSPTMTDALTTYGLPPLIRYFAKFAGNLLPYGVEGLSVEEVKAITSHSAVWLAFEVRNGAFYEPTPPLHRLLDASYIADDVPIGMLTLPADTLCIVPDPSEWERGDKVESIAIFKSPRKLSFALSINDLAGSRPGTGMDAIQLPVDDPDRTIRELVDDVFRGPQPQDEGAKQTWRNALDYAIKMLLYLNVRDVPVTRDNAYSNAARNFSGLGRRKRSERLAEIDMLYDRLIVGPAVFDAEEAHSVPLDGGHHEVRGHWRRPHFRMQPHGPRSSLRKVAFIGPTLVRPDRLGVT